MARSPTSRSPLNYPAMRRTWCRLALQAFLRRWGVYLGVAALAFGAGSASPVAAVAALGAWTVIPLAHAAAHGAWLLPALLLQAGAGLALLAGARSLLWPPRWREAERALPLQPADVRRSDAFVVAVALLPWWLLQAGGGLALLAARPAWLMPVAPRAAAAWVLAQALAWAVGVAGLGLWRRGPRADGVAKRVGQRPAPARRRIGAWRALLWWPLWRGPARRSGRLLLTGGALLTLPAAAMAAQPQALGWGLAAESALALVVVSRLGVLLREELAPLLQAARSLPLRALALVRARQALGLAPLLPGALAVALALAAGSTALRPAVLAAWALASLGSCAWQAFASGRVESEQSARWLFSLALCLALASEVAA